MLAKVTSCALEGLEGVIWQVIYVNDGSSDDSMRIMLEQSAKDSRFSIIDLSRNFGHQAAIAAGLAHADGDAVIFMDGDLQDPPELIPDMVNMHLKEKCNIVYGVRKKRKKEGFLKKLTAKLSIFSPCAFI